MNKQNNIYIITFANNGTEWEIDSKNALNNIINNMFDT